MNHRNPFAINMYETNSEEETNNTIQLNSESVQQDTSVNYEAREAHLYSDLFLEKKKLAEAELMILTQKLNSSKVVIQNFELKIQQLNRDIMLYNTNIEDKKREVDALTREYESRKKISDEFAKQ